jgi:hypothetical protein
MARRTVTDQALPDGVYPYVIGSGDNKQQDRYYAKLADGATKRGFTIARAASRYKKARTPRPARPSRPAARSRRCGRSICARGGPTWCPAHTTTTTATAGCA